MRSMVILGAALLVACGARHGSTATPAMAEATVPCAVFVPSADSLEWKLVQAEGFTFCVPPGWRRSSARRWYVEGAGVEWALGKYPETTTIGVRRFRAGITGPDLNPRHFVEIIGGASAELWETHIQDADYTGAEWAEKHVYFQGKANGPRTADVELMIYRTVRFDAADLGS